MSETKHTPEDKFSYLIDEYYLVNDETIKLDEAAEIAKRWNAHKALVSTLETTLAALKDVVSQIPNNEGLADYRLDFAESAEQQAMDLLKQLK